MVCYENVFFLLDLRRTEKRKWVKAMALFPCDSESEAALVLLSLSLFSHSQPLSCREMVVLLDKMIKVLSLFFFGFLFFFTYVHVSVQLWACYGVLSHCLLLLHIIIALELNCLYFFFFYKFHIEFRYLSLFVLFIYLFKVHCHCMVTKMISLVLVWLHNNS